MEVQVLEALEDFLISISVTLMRSLGKLLFCGCVFKLLSHWTEDPEHEVLACIMPGSLLFVLSKFLTLTVPLSSHTSYSV